MDTSNLLLAASAGLMVALGSVHLLYTYRGHKLEPRDPAVRVAMEATHPVITRQTTMWRAVKGFNASHSLGMIAFGLTYADLAIQRPDVLQTSSVLPVLGMTVLLAYLALAKRYFFQVPLVGVALACGLYAAGWGLS